jgi:hypothetical protein
MRDLDDTARRTQVRGLTVMRAEAQLITESWARGTVTQDGARGGRDLRLHVGGDVSCADGASILAGAADTWYSKGGGSVWTFTHRWREIPSYHWGEINALASVESTAEARQAIQLGYTPALVLERHPSDQAFVIDGLRVIPCPAQTRGTTCVECRLCLDGKLPHNAVIAFAAHGKQQDRVLTHLRTG